MAQLNFDATQHEPASGQQDPLPYGWYNVIIDETALKPTRNGAGSYLQIRFSVLEGPFTNRKVYTQLNIFNSNKTAQEIAYGELSAICHAIGRLNISDDSELHNTPLKIKVTVKPADGRYGPSNEVRAFKNVNEVVEEVGAQQPVQMNQAPPQQPVQPQQQWSTPQNNPQPWANQAPTQQPAQPETQQQPPEQTTSQTPPPWGQ